MSNDVLYVWLNMLCTYYKYKMDNVFFIVYSSYMLHRLGIHNKYTYKYSTGIYFAYIKVYQEKMFAKHQEREPKH